MLRTRHDLFFIRHTGFRDAVHFVMLLTYQTDSQALFSRLLFSISELDLSCLFRVLFGYISFGILNTVTSPQGQRIIIL